MENEPCLHVRKRPPRATSAGPDGVEAWMVALAACFINFIMAGLGRMAGIIYVALIDKFKIDRGQASLPFTVRSSVRNLFGPAVGILGQKYGVRPVIILGGIVGTISAAMCFYINDIVWLTVVYGGINGVGTALTTTLPQVIIGQHFDKYRSTASGIAFSGGCVGSFAFPALIEYLLYLYDTEGTFLIIAGLISHVIPAAFILKEPSWWNDKKTKKQPFTINCEKEEPTYVAGFNQGKEAKGKSTDSVSVSLPQTDNDFNHIQSSAPLLYNENAATQRTFKCNIDVDFLWQNRHILMKVLTNNFTLRYEQLGAKHNEIVHTDDVFVKEVEFLLRQSETNASNCEIDFVNSPPIATEHEKKFEGSENVNFTNGSVQPEALNGEINAISINYVVYYLEKLFQRDRNDILQNFSEEQHKDINKILEDLEKLHSSLISYEINRTEIPKDSEFLETSENGVRGSCERSNTFYSHIKTAGKLYVNPMFLLICFCRAVHFMTFIPAVTIIVDYSMDKGLSSGDGKFVIAALSLGDLLGRLCLGWITDWGYVTLPRYMLSVMFLQGVATVILPTMESRAAIMISMAVFGLLQGSAFVRHPVLVARYLDNHEQHIAMGCINFFSGLIGLILPPYISYFRDSIGSYDGLFYINGSIEAFIGLLWWFEPNFLRLTPHSDLKENEETEV